MAKENLLNTPTAPSAADFQTPHLPSAWAAPIVRDGRRILPSRILPGPMEGIMRDSFCQVMAARGLVDCWITPFIRVSEGVPRQARLLKRLEAFGTDKRPVVAQIMGCNTAFLAETAARLVELGVAGVDLNCACPSPIVVNNGAGGALLKNPDWIYRTLTAIRARCCEVGLSVKLRTGLRSPLEMDRVLEAARAADVDFVILHFRTVAEMYAPVQGGVERLARARERLADKLLIGSGDVFTVESARQMHRVAGVDGVAPARGLLRNPWLLREMQAACRGEPPGGDRSLAVRLQLLLDMAESARLNGVRQHGFVVCLALELLAEEHAILDDLKHLRTLAEACDYLKRRCDIEQ